MNKDMTQLAKLATEQGWEVIYARAGHLVWNCPACSRKIFSSSTPKSRRSRRDHLALMKKHQFEYEGKSYVCQLIPTLKSLGF